MAISPYVSWLRSKVGQQQLLLPCVTVLVRNDSGRILLARHDQSTLWGTVGGMVEPQEHPAQAVTREVKEETGLDVEVTSLIAAVGGPDYCVTYPNGDQVSYVSSVYDARLVGGVEVIDAEELSEVGWFTQRELADLELDRFATALFQELTLIPR